ncbi:ANTAR domain-containing protein [Jatrophihabitans sp. DSM 45814]
MTDLCIPLSDAAPGPEQPVHIADVLQAMDQIVASAEPLIVFTSVAEACVPLVCDAVTVSLVGAGEKTQRITWPRSPDDPADSAGRVLIPITSDAIGPNGVAGARCPDFGDLALEYRGTLELRFHPPRTVWSTDLIGHLIVERAQAIIHQEHRAECLRAAEARIDNLDRALTSNREIGIAVGILMAAHRFTAEQAFDLLRRVSQHTHRKVREVALDVAEAGSLELPSGVPLISSTRSNSTGSTYSQRQKADLVGGPARSRSYVRCRPTPGPSDHNDGLPTS